MNQEQMAINFDRVPSVQWQASANAAAKAKRDNTIDDRFTEWLQINGDFAARFLNRARLLKRKGWEKYSPDALVHALRYSEDRKGPGRITGFSDHFVSRLSRWAMRRDPLLRGFFETRSIKVSGAEVPRDI